MVAPLTLHLYDKATNELKATFTQSFIPWRLLKEAVHISQKLHQDEMTDDDLDALAGLVVATFGDRFSLQDVTEGADVGEMMTVINGIVARASGRVPANPTEGG